MPTTISQRTIHETIGTQIYDLKGVLTEQDLDTLADALLSQIKEKAKAEIHQYASRLKASMAESAVTARLRYDVFLEPMPRNAAPKVLAKFGWGETQEEPTRTAHRVRAVDFAAFAKAHGLKTDDVVRLSAGEIREVKGWERDNRNYPGQDSLRVGQAYRETPPPQPKEKTVYRIQMQTPTLKPPVEFVPTA